ncbi:sigma-54-dependent Fis family transcriptional regulator [candidate division TA06 bacterium]|nr:sigma-54-dependent Fis family transcriptional regulator [candidate division TA06 bacterium]
MGTYHILIVDDEENIRTLLQEGLSQYHYVVETAEDGFVALDKVKKTRFDIAIVDIKMPKMDGVEVIRSLKEENEQIEIIVLTAFATVDTAVAALKLGASDYLTKPTRIEEIYRVISNILEKKRLKEENISLKRRLYEQKKITQLLSASPKMREINEIITRVANNDSPVFIEGESGTGKELVAQAIHFSSLRSEGPFIPINCGAIPENLLESELFGHKKGAFTGAIADNLGLFRSAHRGTIFLDEISEMASYLQVKLLRVLQEQKIRPVGSVKPIEIDVRVISATNREVRKALSQEILRNDLYYRLSVVHLKLPPLRERKEDIPLLSNYFIKSLNEKYKRRVKGFSQEALNILHSYPWPGNVRELENVIERAFALHCGDLIATENLPSTLLEPSSPSECEEPLSLRNMEKELIQKALMEAKGNKRRAAELLGIGRKTIYRKIKTYDLE